MPHAPHDADLFRLLYCSRNTGGEPAGAAEIERILAVSRANNSSQGVSGALLFNAGCFAQVLEGSRRAVEDTYERIACDPRHADITVLEAGACAARDFPGWSMAYAGAIDEATRPLMASALHAAFTGSGPGPGSGGGAMLDLLRRAVGREGAAA